ncbi:hypothetical protein HID58_031304 [Brassica napus]|uniref:Uncharacterized protein n=1 Tax=Brassica napus TaxID=3708 RepID=A0ABQ8CIE2_BRANA|nr:UPF0725 protein EMB2204-like [Brassica napus]KAH0916858.1 hypothetical protein HID58_031304 [Brassica napus]
MSQSGLRTEELDRFNYPEGFARRRGSYALAHFECEGKLGKMYGGYPNSALVKLFAKLGLHRYNWLEGTNFQFGRLKRFNMGSAATAYFITLVARLPTSHLEQIFQVVVEEERLGILDLTCRHSRPHEGTESSKKEMPSLRPHRQPVPTSYKGRLFDWPSSDFAWPSSFSDTKRFYLLNESELQCDWISLYVELAICTSHRKIKARDLTKFHLEIVQVAIESLDDKEPPSLMSRAALLYVTYKDVVKSLRTGEPCLSKAAVRRVFNESKGRLSIQGDCWVEAETGLAFSEIPSKKSSKKGSLKLKRRLGVHKLWRLSSPRWYQTYKNRGDLDD